ncbi:hypothetical protein Misp02_71560 [Microtetraspora sp. NBRC 16547]|nr:hypothetical protein Misp02_71560 [Microtetraspora sp. NBRC 16547]
MRGRGCGGHRRVAGVAGIGAEVETTSTLVPGSLWTPSLAPRTYLPERDVEQVKDKQ